MTTAHQSLSIQDSEEESFIILGTSPPISMQQSLIPGSSLSIIDVGTENSQSNGVTNGQTSRTSEVQGQKTLIEPKAKEASGITSIMNQSAFGNSFASKFLLGEVDKKSMQTSVFQQFPSLNSNNLETDDVVKLFSLLDEHAQLKDNLEKANTTMRRQYTVLQQWQDVVKTKLEEKNGTIDNLNKSVTALQLEKQALEEMNQKHEITIENLKKELNEIMSSFKTFEETVAKEHQELRMQISEKDSIIKNIHAENERLQLEASNFVVLQRNKKDSLNLSTSPDYILKSEHDRIVKDYDRKMSALVAENLEFNDMKHVYKEELDCLKVNLTSAEELHKEMQHTIATLQKSNTENSKRAEEKVHELQMAMDEIALLKVQVDVYRNDFEQEREAREKIATEKADLMVDLKLLQTRNKQLIDEAQERLKVSPTLGASTSQNTEQAQPTAPSSSKSNSPEKENDPVRYICPICSTDLKTLRLLEQHIDICLKD